MLFNSYAFIFGFLPIVFCGFYIVAILSHNAAAAWLAAASLFFYAWTKPSFLFLLSFSIAFNYLCGYAISHAASRVSARRWLILGVTVDLLTLGVFKYFNFFVATTNAVAGTEFGLAAIALPIGISFYTFTQIAFLIDVARGEAKEYNFVHYALFVSYFPHLVAGPVLHHKQMMPQFGNPAIYRLDADRVFIALIFFSIGMAKKVLLADSLGAPYASPVFDAVQAGARPTFGDAWFGALAYTFQLYFDFSGYSDMAIALSLLFGVRLPLNFNSPYKAANIIDFWRRWHMTLSQFLRDYLYISLGGNKKGKARRYLNLVITMLLGGLWHGASWTFVVWGGLHGLYLVINHGWLALRQRLGWTGSGTPLWRAASIALTFVSVVVAWVFFRAQSFAAAHRMLQGMVGLNGLTSEAHNSFELIATPTRLAALLLLCLILCAMPNSQQLTGYSPQVPTALTRQPKWVFGAVAGFVLAFCVLYLRQGESEFLYFQF